MGDVATLDEARWAKILDDIVKRIRAGKSGSEFLAMVLQKTAKLSAAVAVAELRRENATLGRALESREQRRVCLAFALDTTKELADMWTGRRPRPRLPGEPAVKLVRAVEHVDLDDELAEQVRGVFIENYSLQAMGSAEANVGPESEVPVDLLLRVVALWGTGSHKKWPEVRKLAKRLDCDVDGDAKSFAKEMRRAVETIQKGRREQQERQRRLERAAENRPKRP